MPVNLGVYWQHSSPYAVEDEEELDKDTAKGKYATHQRAGNRVGQPALVRDLTRNLIGPHRLFNGLEGEPMLDNPQRQQQCTVNSNAAICHRNSVTLYPY